MRPLIVAGGGTGGHVFAGLALIAAWRARVGGDAPVLFIGAAGGIEEKQVARAPGVELKLLQIGALNRVSWSRRFKTILELPLAGLLSAFWILKYRPQAVIGVGGFSSGPVLLAGAILGRPFFGTRTAILEQNTVPGFTNRRLAAWVDRVFSAFPPRRGAFDPSKVLVTGNPIRPEIQPLPSVAERKPLGIFVFGGSLGAVGMNTLVLEALPFLEDLRGQLSWVHQTGKLDFERVRKAHESANTGARVEPFIQEMMGAYAEAGVVVCRAGSSTLAELAQVGRAAILVPLPTASDDHQAANARVFAEAGGALVAPQKTTEPRAFAEMVRGLVRDRTRIAAMEASVRLLARPAAAKNAIDALLTGQD